MRSPAEWDRRLILVATALTVLFASMRNAAAHPISVVSELAYVNRDAIDVEVEIFAEDLYFYHDLSKTDAGVVSRDALRSAAAKHGPLLLERLPVFDAQGQRLIGGVVASVEGHEFPKDLLPGELMEHSLIYRLRIPLGSPPEFLTFSQRLVDSSAGFPALVDFRVKQAGIEEEAVATLKPGQVRTVQFTWDESRSESDAAGREAWMQARRDDTLGVSALNTIRSFLYITPREVRHELLVPFPLVESFLTVDRSDPDFLSHDEQQAAKPIIGTFFASKNPVSVDGVVREPASTRVEFFTLDDRNLAKEVPRRTVSAVNCRVGVIISYPTSRPPDAVQLVWDAFNREAWRVDAFCFVGDDVLRPEFSAAKRQDTFTWTRPAPPPVKPVPVAHVAPPSSVMVPMLSLALGLVAVAGALLLFRRRLPLAVGVALVGFVLAVGLRSHATLKVTRPFASAPEVTAEEADDIVQTLHANLYRAADAATDEEVAEALAASADTRLARSLLLQLIEYLRFGEDEEATLAIHDVAIRSGERIAEREARAGFDYLLTWDVTSRLEHWGHIHDRRYRYEAVLAIEPRQDRWAITDIDLRDVRMLEDNSETPREQPATTVSASS